jgi:hypothetical protein
MDLGISGGQLLKKDKKSNYPLKKPCQGYLDRILRHMLRHRLKITG